MIIRVHEYTLKSDVKVYMRLSKPKKSTVQPKKGLVQPKKSSVQPKKFREVFVCTIPVQI